MKTENITLTLPEGSFTSDVFSFEENDRKKLRIIYDDWRNLSVKLNDFGARSVNTL